MNDPDKPTEPSEASDDAGPIPGIETLRRDHAPQRDLWPGIESRVRARRARAWRTAWLVAAGFAAVALVGTNAVLNRVHAPLDGQPAPLRAPAEIAAATLPSRNPAMVQAVVHHWHPETKALVRANLKIVNNAEAQLRKAIETDPDSEYLHSLLAATHQQRKNLKYQLALNDPPAEIGK
jgi:hypothetical protein